MATLSLPVEPAQYVVKVYLLDEVSNQGAILLTWFNFNLVWISNYSQNKVRDEIAYPFSSLRMDK